MDEKTPSVDATEGVWSGRFWRKRSGKLLLGLVFEARQSAALVVAVKGGGEPKECGVAAGLLGLLDFGHHRNVVGAAQGSSLMAKTSLWVWHG